MKFTNKVISSIVAGILLKRLFILTSKYEEQKLDEIKITAPQLYVIAAIKYLPSPVTATDISKWINRTTNAVNITVMSLVRDGMVKRTRNPRDRRHLKLNLTSKSEEIFKKAAELLKIIPSAEYMSVLTSDELQIMINLIQKLSTELMKILDIKEPTADLALHRIDIMNKVLKAEDTDFRPIDIPQLISDKKHAKCRVNKRIKQNARTKN